MKGRPLGTRPTNTPIIVGGGLLGLGDNATVIAACKRISEALKDSR